MTKEEELKKLREEEKMLLSQLNGLRQQSNELKEVPDKQDEQKRIEGIIAAREGALKEVRNEIKGLEGNEIENERVRKLSTKEAFVVVAEMGRAVFGAYKDHAELQQDIANMMKHQPPAAEIVVENPSPDNISLPEAVKKQVEDIEEGLEDLKDTVEKEDRTKDAAKEWEQSIEAKQATLEQARTEKLQKLETNIVWQESYLKDNKKEGYEQQLAQLEENRKKGIEETDKKFNELMKPIDREKEALQKAINDTKDMSWEDRNREIERQRKEFELQLEAELRIKKQWGKEL